MAFSLQSWSAPGMSLTYRPQVQLLPKPQYVPPLLGHGGGGFDAGTNGGGGGGGDGGGVVHDPTQDPRIRAITTELGKYLPGLGATVLPSGGRADLSRPTPQIVGYHTPHAVQVMPGYGTGAAGGGSGAVLISPFRRPGMLARGRKRRR